MKFIQFKMVRVVIMIGLFHIGSLTLSAQDRYSKVRITDPKEIDDIVRLSGLGGEITKDIKAITFHILGDTSLNQEDIIVIEGRVGGVLQREAHIIDPNKSDQLKGLPQKSLVRNIITKHIDKYFLINEQDLMNEPVSLDYNTEEGQLSSFNPPDWVDSKYSGGRLYAAISFAENEKRIQYVDAELVKKTLSYYDENNEEKIFTYYVYDESSIPPLLTGMLFNLSMHRYDNLYYVDVPVNERKLGVLAKSNELPVESVFTGNIEQVVKTDLKYYIEGRTKKIEIMTEEDDILPPGFSGPIGPVDKQVIRENQLKRWTIPILAIISFVMIN